MIEIRDNIAEFEAALTDFARRQLPFAMARALNDTAAEVERGGREEMARVFDRPTRFTLNAFMVDRATKTRLVARVRRKPVAARRDYLATQVRGGARRRTGVEGLLAMRAAVGMDVRAALPADGARLDAYGNWSSGQRNQVLSALGAQRDRAANTTAASARRKKGRLKYFVPRSGLPPGVYSRDGSGRIGIVLAFTSKVPVYRKRWDFHGKAFEAARARFPAHLSRRLREALQTARR